MSASPTPTPGLATTRDAEALHQVSWGAILAGTVTALVTLLVLNVAGIGAGLASVGLDSADNPSAGTVSLGALLWSAGSGIVAAFVGGYLAGRLSGRPVGSTAALHGLVSWAVGTLVVLYLVTSTLGGVVSGTFGSLASALGGAGNVIGGTVRSAAEAAAPALQNVSDPLAGIEDRVRRQSAGQDPQALRDAAVGAVRAALKGDTAERERAENRAVEALAKAQNITPDEARQQVQDYRRQYEEAVKTAKQKAEEAARTTKSVATQSALYAALALVLGALASLLGGRLGAVAPPEGHDGYGVRRRA